MEEKATPDHDALVMWADEMMSMIISSICRTPWEAGPRRVVEDAKSHWRGAIPESIEEELDILAKDQLEWERPTILKKSWEHPVVEKVYKSERIVGYIDILCDVKVKYITIEGLHWGTLTDHCEKRDDAPLQWKVGWTNRSVICEVKPTILSVGATIRQMKKYHYLRDKDDMLCLISPDASYSCWFERQGIHFFHSPPPGELAPLS
jgi:hypothetical protein